MNIIERLGKLLSRKDNNTTTDNRDIIEFRQSKIELLKGEISDIISRIDSNEDYYQQMINSTQEQIEKGFNGGDSLIDHLKVKQINSNKELLKSLSTKKSELRKQEEYLEKLVVDLEKASPKQDYADSIVCNANGDILMLLRKNDDSFEPNKWGLPGGKVEEGEDSCTAAERELIEETNLTAKTCELISVVKLGDGGTIYYHSVRVKEDTDWVALDEEEHSNYTFMSIEEIRRRSSSDFIMDLKETLLDIIDPTFKHIKVLEKAFDSGDLDGETFNKAVDKYCKFNWQTEDTKNN